jgi:hypothetical protein
MHPSTAAVLDGITEESVVELALALGNIDSPAGEEKAVADFVYGWMERKVSLHAR